MPYSAQWESSLLPQSVQISSFLSLQSPVPTVAQCHTNCPLVLSRGQGEQCGSLSCCKTCPGEQNTSGSLRRGSGKCCLGISLPLESKSALQQQSLDAGEEGTGMVLIPQLHWSQQPSPGLWHTHTAPSCCCSALQLCLVPVSLASCAGLLWSCKAKPLPAEIHRSSCFMRAEFGSRYS